jgi:hypothetical protein
LHPLESAAFHGAHPLLPFKIGNVNEREARESGLWLKARVAPQAVFSDCDEGGPN